jgi:hypothetical protein
VSSLLARQALPMPPDSCDEYGGGGEDDGSNPEQSGRSSAPGRVTGYVPKGKSKAALLCRAFVDGAGGGVVHQPPPASLRRGAACFFGVTDATVHIWSQARRARRDWYYLDNAYFDVARGRLFRAVRNGVQAGGDEPPDWPRLAALGLDIRPWRKDGRRVIVVAQSETYMRVVGGYVGCWWKDAIELLRRHTDREIVVRGWRANKMALAKTLREDLRDCWALVTWSSAAANEAVLAGVPVFTAARCAASPMGLSDLRRIESPAYPPGRARWAAALAGRQWALDEIRRGVAWRTLHS